MNEVILIDNPSNLPLLPIDDIYAFQGDLKKEPSETALDKLMRSVLDHHVFIAKAIFYEDGKAYTEDGHQTLKALNALREQGYTRCEVLSYEMQGGQMKEASRTPYDTIMIPCQTIVPKGDTPAARRRDAAEKLLQINSRYAVVNPETTWFEELEFAQDDLKAMLDSIEMPDLHIDIMMNETNIDDFFVDKEDDREEDTSNTNRIICPNCGEEIQV